MTTQEIAKELKNIWLDCTEDQTGMGVAWDLVAKHVQIMCLEARINQTEIIMNEWSHDGWEGLVTLHGLVEQLEQEIKELSKLANG